MAVWSLKNVSRTLSLGESTMANVGISKNITKNLVNKFSFKNRHQCFERRSLKIRKNFLEKVNLLLDEDISNAQNNSINVSITSEDSCHTNNLSELMSIKSAEDDLPVNVFRFSSFNKAKTHSKERKSKRMKLEKQEANSIFELSVTSSEIDIEICKTIDERAVLEETVLQKIKEFKNLPKHVNNKKSIFALTKRYKLIQSDMSIVENEDSPTAKLTVTKLHFSSLTRKLGRSTYFLLVSCGTDVQASNFVKTNKDFITFEDVFTFENCPLNFRIQVQLYALRLNAKLKMMMRKAPLMDRIYEWHKARKEEKNDDVAESTCFELLDYFDLTSDDLHKNDIGTIKDKVSLGKSFKFSLKIDHVNVEKQRNGFLRMYVKKLGKWERFWCVLFGTVLKIYPSVRTEEFSPVLYINLKYATYSKIDQNDILIIKHVRPSKENEENEPTLESRNNFVVIQHLFKAVNFRYLVLWMSDINFVIKSLDQWNFSFLYSTELEM